MAPQNVYNPLTINDNHNDNNNRKCRHVERLVHIHDNSHDDNDEKSGKQSNHYCRWSDTIVTYVNHCRQQQQQQQYHQYNSIMKTNNTTTTELSPVSSYTTNNDDDDQNTITTIITNNSNENSNCNHIDTLIESRKKWPVGITTRSAIRMMRSSCGHHHHHYNGAESSSSSSKSLLINEKNPITKKRKEKSQSSTELASCQQINKRPNEIRLKKLKSFRVLVFGSINKHNNSMNNGRIGGNHYNYNGQRFDNNFLKKCRHNFIIESTNSTKKINNNIDLISTYNINYACDLSNVYLELCFLKWPDSFQTKSEFYQQTFAKYFAMTNIAIGYYDPDDLESIEHMQSWIKAFYDYHYRNNNNNKQQQQSKINTIIIRIEDSTSTKNFRQRLLRKSNDHQSYDHVISSSLNQYSKTMYHMTIKHRLFGRRPSLKPLWKIMYLIITMDCMTSKKYLPDENSLIIDRIENVERRCCLYQSHHNSTNGQETFGKLIGRFIRNLTNGIWKRFKQQQRQSSNHWF
uniref:Uncharacterized protein n=1 Tax=Dermatophagoides pteronyssinus TaxID=6956 RepID=A0A6P6YIU1_DERPT|nr:putative uncharacterized protein DDB_G0282133 [Dermatophagoides pteronyssinus]